MGPYVVTLDKVAQMAMGVQYVVSQWLECDVANGAYVVTPLDYVMSYAVSPMTLTQCL